MAKKIKCEIKEVARHGDAAVLKVLLSEGGVTRSWDLRVPAQSTPEQVKAQIGELAANFARRDQWFAKIEQLANTESEIEVPDVQEPAEGP